MSRATGWAAARGRLLLRRLAAGLGLYVVSRRRYGLVRRGYYSPLPELEELSAEIWTRRSRLAGIAFDPAAQVRFAQESLERFIREFDAPLDRPADAGPSFFIRNPTYGSVCAEVAYAMVRHFRPARVLEFGSGNSSWVLGRACEANRADGVPADYTSFDPYPGDAPPRVPGRAELRRTRAQDVPLEEFGDLAGGDILFVDTSHVVRIGGDVNYLILDVLPVLAPGVVVHFHDIFLPWEYHRAWIEEAGRFWTEQYLLQAFLALNPSYEVLFGAHAVARDHESELEALVPSFTPGHQPSCFWIRRAA